MKTIRAFQTLYIDNNTVIHDIHPSAKIALVSLMLVDFICIHQLEWMLLLLAVIVVFWIAAKISIRMLFVTISMLSLLLLSNILYHSWIQKQPLMQSMYVCFQILGIVLSFTLLVRTTSPMQLANGFETLLRPLQKIGIPTNDLAMLLMIALRFIPTLTSEFEKIYRAQIVRGGGYSNGGIKGRLQSYLPVLLPMFIQAILRAEELATAMEARCYDSKRIRTTLTTYSKNQLRLHVTIGVIIPVGVFVLYLITP